MERTVRVPKALEPGDVIGVTAPSSGVGRRLLARYEACVASIRARGFRVREGGCLFSDGIVSAPAEDRAAELMAFLLDPEVKAVMPPWGGELLIDLLPLLDFEALADAEPTWFVSWSDGTTFMLPLLLRTGWASLHGMNTMDALYTPPDEVARWWDVLTAPAGSTFAQRSVVAYQQAFRDYADDPHIDAWWPQVPTRWSRLGTEPRTSSSPRQASVGAPLAGGPQSRPAGERVAALGSGNAAFTGRLVGGCADVVSRLVGTGFAEVQDWAPPEGTIVFLENCEMPAPEAARCWHQLVMAGWFDHCNGVLVGRTKAPETPAYTQRQAVADAFAPLVARGIPVLVDVDIGHQPPQLLLVMGALATVELIDGQGTIHQTLGVPTPP
jgi:muramoyltetrapeptide carboxypeptidase LdcA involved in peptidoglycan recycling